MPQENLAQHTVKRERNKAVEVDKTPISDTKFEGGIHLPPASEVLTRRYVPLQSSSAPEPSWNP